MDTGDGNFQKLSAESPLKMQAALALAQREHPNHGGTFYVGQSLEMNDSKFIVIGITKKTITLKILPR